jgi:hypothetical protein
VVVDPGRGFYAPAVATLGIDLDRVTVVRPGSRADVLWTLEQALRCAGVSGVLCPLEKVNDREFRRLQLAAEAGDNFGMLLRPSRMCGRSSWADLRLEVSPLSGNVSEPGDCPHFVSLILTHKSRTFSPPSACHLRPGEEPDGSCFVVFSGMV